MTSFRIDWLLGINVCCGGYANDDGVEKNEWIRFLLFQKNFLSVNKIFKPKIVYNSLTKPHVFRSARYYKYMLRNVRYDKNLHLTGLFNFWHLKNRSEKNEWYLEIPIFFLWTITILSCTFDTLYEQPTQLIFELYLRRMWWCQINFHFFSFLSRDTLCIWWLCYHLE